MSGKPLDSSVHRMLVTRVAAVALLLGTLFAAIAFVTQQRRLESTISELALLQVARFNRQALDILDQAAGLDAVALQAELESFSAASGGTRIGDGHFVLARVFDASGEELAQITEEDHPDLAAVSARVDTAGFEPLGPEERRAVTVEIDGGT